MFHTQRGTHNKVLYREALPQGPTLYPFFFLTENVPRPFIYLLLKNGILFIYLAENFESLVTAVNEVYYKLNE